MSCCIAEMRNKEVICRSNGCRLGNIDDVEFETCTGQIVCIVIYAKNRLFGKYGDIKIPWDKVAVVGEDTILVDYCLPEAPIMNRKRFF